MDLELIRTIISGLTLASIAIAFVSYRLNLSKQKDDQLVLKDKELIDQAILSLRWAYEALTDSGENTSPPRADRLNWLTCARHLCRFKELSNQISTNTYQTICAEHEEYWRHQFYLSLDNLVLRRKNYYMDASDVHWPENIEPNSALVINSFANWPDHITDPLTEEAVLNFNKDNQGYKENAGIGITAYMEHFEKLVHEMKKENDDKPQLNTI